MFVYENRASAILYNLIKNLDEDKFFILPTNVCPIVVMVLLKLQKKIMFIDISETDFCIDRKTILYELKKFPNKYSGLLFVRTYGVSDDFEHFFKELKTINSDLFVIDDKCLSLPSFFDNMTVADVTLYSTGYSKYVDFGTGGFARLNDKIPYSSNLLEYKVHDLETLTDSLNFGIREHVNIDYKDSNWLNTTIPKLSFNEYKQIIQEKVIEISLKKEQINRIYSEGLPASIQLPDNYQNWRFNILVPEKKILLKKIFHAGLFASSHYPPSSNLFDKDSVFPNAKKLYDNVINLFNDHRFSVEKAEKFIPIINNHLKQF